MATFRKVIAMVDRKKPNSFDEEQKFQWLAELDGNIAADIFLVDIKDIRELGYTYPDDMDRELLVTYPHEGVYDAWLSAMIDQENGEYEKYQNTMQIYNERLSRYARWFGRTYEPAQGGWVRRPGTPTWYLTAYGLACSQGFAGTLEEWLASLVGPQGEQGRSIKNVELTGDGELLIEFDDGVKTYPGAVTAYGLACEQGFEGTLQEWLASLVGPRGEVGPEGLSVESAWIEEAGELVLGMNDGSKITAGNVVGPAGPQGAQGAAGRDGVVAVSGASVGDGVVVTAVDENGVPTAWKPLLLVDSVTKNGYALQVNYPNGDGYTVPLPTDTTLTQPQAAADAKAVGDAIWNANDWEVINTITFTEEGITAFTIDRDKNGNPFELCDMIIRTDTAQASLGGTVNPAGNTMLVINGKNVANLMALSSSERLWRAIATVINTRVWFGWTNFSDEVMHGKGIPMTALQTVEGELLNDNSITSVGINILNPKLMYFAVGYTLTLYGRRKK